MSDINHPFYDPRAIPGTPGFGPPPQGFVSPSDPQVFGCSPQPQIGNMNQFISESQQQMVNFPYIDPNQQQQYQQQNIPYYFMRRINKMNWDMMANIDVATISKTNDTVSIDFLMRHIAFANITSDDTEMFGSRASYHAFLLLQLSVEYLLFKLNNIPQPQYIPVPQQTTPSSSSIANYEARIDMLNKDINSRDMIINQLTDRINHIEAERDELIAQLSSLRRSMKKGTTNDTTDSSVEPTTKQSKSTTLRNTLAEIGLVPDDDKDYEEYKMNRPKIRGKSKPLSSRHKNKSTKNKEKSKKHSKKSSKKHVEYEYEYEYYSDSAILEPEPNKKKDKKNKQTNELPNDWGSSSGWN